MCPTPHQKKSNCLVPEHEMSSPLLSQYWMFSPVSSLLFYSLSHVLGPHLSVPHQIPLLPPHRSLWVLHCLCSGLKIFVRKAYYWGSAGQTAEPWLGSAFEGHLADLTVLWTQQKPPPTVYGQRRGAGPGLHRLHLKSLRLGWWGQGFETWSPNDWEGYVSQWLRFWDILLYW